MTGRRQNKKRGTARNTGSPNGRKNRGADRAAIFLNRDGTITEELGYVNHIIRARLFTRAPKAIRIFNSTGLPVIVVTNQSGIGRGYFAEVLVAQVHQEIQDELEAWGTEVDAYHYCQRHPSAPLKAYRQDCPCRKPSTGMTDEAAGWFGTNLRASYVVGATYRNMQMGFNIGARMTLLMTSSWREEYEHHRTRWSRVLDRMDEYLLEAAQQILRELNAPTTSDAASRPFLA